MNRLDTTKAERYFTQGYIVLLFVGYLFIVFRQLGTLPSILGDEFLYKQQVIEFGSYSSSTVGSFGNFLFDFVYQASSACGPNFYTCVKGINGLFLVMAAVFIFLTALLFLNRWLSALLSLTMLLSPLAGYVGNFMPESMYIGIATGVIYFLLLYFIRGTRPSFYAFSILFGLLLLVKPHGLLLIAPFAVLFLFPIAEKPFLRRLFSFVAAISISFAVRFGVGFLVAGPRSLNIAGDYLGQDSPVNPQNNETDIASTLMRIFETLLSILPNQLLLHSIGFVFVGLVFLAVAFVPREHDALRRSGIVLGIVFLGLVAQTILFTAYVTSNGDDHTFRMLARYYEWLYAPMVVIGIASLARIAEARRTPRVFFASISIVGIVIISVAFLSNYLASQDLKLSDIQFFAGAIANPLNYFLAPIILFIVVVFLLLGKQRYFPTVVIAYSVVFAIFGASSAERGFDFRGTNDSGDLAGQFADDFIGNAAFGEDIWVVSNTNFGASSAAFWIGKPGVQRLVVQRHAVVSNDVLDGPVNWVLAVNDVSFQAPSQVVASGLGFRLHQVGERDIYYPSRESPNSSIEFVDGEKINTFWGHWISGSGATYKSDNDLGGKTLKLRLKILDPNKSEGATLVLDTPMGTSAYDLKPISDGSSVNELELVLPDGEFDNFTLRLRESSTFVVNNQSSFPISEGRLLGLVSLEILQG